MIYRNKKLISIDVAEGASSTGRKRGDIPVTDMNRQLSKWLHEREDYNAVRDLKESRRIGKEKHKK